MKSLIKLFIVTMILVNVVTVTNAAVFSANTDNVTTIECNGNCGGCPNDGGCPSQIPVPGDDDCDTDCNPSQD